ncbi:MAG: primosomal protein N' [Candidatus Neomarinimicrobiota bacterium]
MFVEIAFPISNFQTFTYSVPDHLIVKVQIGSRVNAPFGNRKLQGIIVNVTKKNPYKGKIKSIHNLIDDIQVVTADLWSLMNWISDYYITPIGQVAKTVLPNNLSTRYEPIKNWFVKSEKNQNQSILDKIKKRAPKQYLIFHKIKSSKSLIKVSSLKEYASNPLQICRILEKNNLVILLEKTLKPDIGKFLFDPIDKEVKFNCEQAVVSRKISLALDKNRFKPFLLHGVTGSGKTEIYIEAVRQCLELKRTAVILLPEISLTPQIAGRFRSVFGDKIALWHSKLTQRQRSITWKEICKGTFKVVIGARSAVFTPLKNLGLIVIDEEQESSFCQDSPAPRYHARDVALVRAKQTNSVIVLASATPSLESFYNHLNNKLTYLHLPSRYGGAKYPKVHLVDMLEEQDETGKFGQVISGLLQDKIEERLNNNEQIILLQNRRGYSPVIRCADCTEILKCPHCNVAITYHQHNMISNLLCHLCGFSYGEKFNKCNFCKNNNLIYSGTGTQKVETIIREIFPNASIRRLDVDSSLSGSNLTRILKDFNNGEIDILLGTQMIAKGLDFPNATLVGIINADLGLYIPDFRAGERIFQLIYQAAGRSGRRNKQGEVVIQTYSSNNPVIKKAAKLDMFGYYKIALREREELDYAPYSWMAKIEIKGINQKKTSALANKLTNSIRGLYKGLNVLGPSPCYIEKIRGEYRFQIVFKSLKSIDPSAKKLHTFIKFNFYDIHKQFKIKKTRISIHFDPLSLI